MKPMESVWDGSASAAAKQMLRPGLRSAKRSHFVRSLLFLTSRTGLRRGRFWAEAMAADLLIFDYQDGCQPGEHISVTKSIGMCHEIFPGSLCSVRLTELEPEYAHQPQTTSKIIEEIRTSIAQPQVHWLLLPMCDESKDVQTYIDMINEADKNWLSEHGQLQLICETPRCLKNLDDILSDHPSIAAVIVGAGDFARYTQLADKTRLADLLGWDILNACLRHGRFPIGTPTLAIKGDSSAHFQAVADSGFRSCIVLYPTQVEACNQSFTPRQDLIETILPQLDTWISSGASGYQQGSGKDFVGPPHMKQKLWMAQYAAEFSLERQHCGKADKALIPELKRIFENTPAHGTLLGTMLPFLALGNTLHPDHGSLLANLNISDPQWMGQGMGQGMVTGPEGESLPQALEDVSLILTEVIHRRMTSQGKMVVSEKVILFNQEHQALLSFVRRVLQNVIPYSDVNKIPVETKRVKQPGSAQPAVRSRIKPDEVEARAGQRVAEHSLRSPNRDLHTKLCKLCGYHAPVHWGDSPILPSTLHLACHRIVGPELGFDSESIAIIDMTFHSPMKADSDCINIICADRERPGSYISILRTGSHMDRDSSILSTVFFTPKGPVEP